MSAEDLNRDQLRAIKTQEHVPGTPPSMNRQQRRMLERRASGPPLVFGGQRWKCTNVQCGFVAPNSAHGVPEALMAQTAPGRSTPLCPVCAEKVMPLLLRLIPALAPFDPDSSEPFEEQIRKVRDELIADKERQYQAAVERGDAPAGDDMAAPTTEERAEAAGLAIAR